jgi:hypothetical protein
MALTTDLNLAPGFNKVIAVPLLYFLCGDGRIQDELYFVPLPCDTGLRCLVFLRIERNNMWGMTPRPIINFGQPAGITALVVIKTAWAEQLAFSAAFHAVIFIYSPYKNGVHELWKVPLFWKPHTRCIMSRGSSNATVLSLSHSACCSFDCQHSSRK